MGKGRASLRPLSAALALVTGGNEQTEAGKEGGRPPDCRGVGVDKNAVLAGSCSCWLHLQLTQKVIVLMCPSSFTFPSP